MKFEVGDIVFVSKYSYDQGEEGKNHLFVIIDDDNKLVPIEYFGMIVSSRIEKSKEVSKYKYNEPLKKNQDNHLNTDSIVKCDQIFTIPTKNIQFKIGQIDIDDYKRFMDAYNAVLKELDEQIQDI